jgi:DNA-binding NtrC family response regulator
VRELENVIQRMVVLADETAEVLTPAMLPAVILDHHGTIGPGADSHDEFHPPGVQKESRNDSPVRAGEFSLPDSGVNLADLEADLIQQALVKARGRLEPAAQLLGITYKTLQYRVKKYGLQEHQK